MADRSMQVDVIIVGAGLSGLMAALTLKKSGQSFIVLEAQSRVGGRVFTSTQLGKTIDFGAQFVSPHQTRIKKLLQKYDLTTTTTYHKGKTLYAFCDKKKWSNGKIPPLSLLSLLDFFKMKRVLKKLIKPINPTQPWESKDAEKLDALTMENWLKNVMSSKEIKTYYRVLAEEGLCVDLNEISILDVLWNLKTTGSLKKMLTAEDEWITEGAGALPSRMAFSLKDHIKLNEEVKKIEWTPSKIRVLTNNHDWFGLKVIIAIPPPLIGQIEFEPSLPNERNKICQSFGLGCSIKCVIVYDTPFWRERGESGSAFYDKGPIKGTVDISPTNQQNGMLTAFIIGNEAKRLQNITEEVRKEEILDCLVYLFGPKARHPIAYYEKDWSADPWAKGGYGAHFAPGFLTRLGEVLTKPIGPIHWAGTETAAEWRLYMEGALEAGERAAFEVLQALEKSVET